MQNKHKTSTIYRYNSDTYLSIRAQYSSKHPLSVILLYNSDYKHYICLDELSVSFNMSLISGLTDLTTPESFSGVCEEETTLI